MVSGDSGFAHIDDRLVHQGYVWHVAVSRFRSPDGEVFQRDIVRSPGAVAAVPLWLADNGTEMVTLVKQYRPPFDADVIEIPAGMRDVPDEPTDATAARELVEEVGLRPGVLTPLGGFYPSAGMTDSVLHLFLATQLERVPAAAHGPEETHMTVLEWPLADAVAAVIDGRICDGKTMIGLLLVERMLREGALPAH